MASERTANRPLLLAMMVARLLMAKPAPLRNLFQAWAPTKAARARFLPVKSLAHSLLTRAWSATLEIRVMLGVVVIANNQGHLRFQTIPTAAPRRPHFRRQFHRTRPFEENRFRLP